MLICNHAHNIIRREALYLWKQKLGSEATSQRLISAFERADYRNYAEIVRNIICENESEVDDSSDYDEPIPQPETYPYVKLSPQSSPVPKLSRRVSSCDEYRLINPATAKGLPEGENCSYLTSGSSIDLHYDHYNIRSGA